MASISIDINKRYTFADYLTWIDDTRRELIDGFVKLMSPAPLRKHQRIVGRLHLAIGNYLKKQPCHVYTAPFDVRLPKDKNEKSDDKIFNVVQPDICVICDLSKLDDKGCIGAPDLVVEIVSPGSAERDMKDKYYLYQDAGVKEYWLVLTEETTIQVFTLNVENKYELTGVFSGKEIMQTKLFPGLEIDCSETFTD